LSVLKFEIFYQGFMLKYIRGLNKIYVFKLSFILTYM